MYNIYIIQNIKVYKTYSRFFSPIHSLYPFPAQKIIFLYFLPKETNLCFFIYTYVYVCIHISSYFLFLIQNVTYCTISIYHSFTVCFFDLITHLGYNTLSSLPSFIFQLHTSLSLFFTQISFLWMAFTWFPLFCFGKQWHNVAHVVLIFGGLSSGWISRKGIAFVVEGTANFHSMWLYILYSYQQFIDYWFPHSLASVCVAKLKVLSIWQCRNSITF